MANGNGDEVYSPMRPHRTSESNLRDYLSAKIDGNRELSDATFKSQETAVNAALVAAEKAVNAALAASEKAIGKAESAQQRVNEGQNEFRATLKDQANTLMPRTETESLVREIRALIAANSTDIGTLRSRIDVGPPSLSTLQSRSDEEIGYGKRGQQFMATLLAVAAIVAGVLGVVLGRMLV